jgi:hypothetical protein
MNDANTKGLSRFSMEVVVAALTGIFGAAVCFEAKKAGTGWTEMGPDAGYFPFYIGLLIVAGSLANGVQAFLKFRRSDEVFLDAHRFKVVATFLLPMVAFAVVSIWLGLYVGTALYIAGTMCFQGRYKWWISLLLGIGVSVFFFVVFEYGFQVPLLKGPVEAWFGIY